MILRPFFKTTPHSAADKLTLDNDNKRRFVFAQTSSVFMLIMLAMILAAIMLKIVVWPVGRNNTATCVRVYARLKHTLRGAFDCVCFGRSEMMLMMVENDRRGGYGKINGMKNGTRHCGCCLFCANYCALLISSIKIKAH